MNAPMVYRGKSLGVLVLVTTQMIIGVIHVVFGFWLLLTPSMIFLDGSTAGVDIYSIYTIVFGLLALIFSAGLWLTKRWGWAGTVAIAVFVTVADTLTLLDLPSIPGTSKLAGLLEVSYSILILLYLLQPHIQSIFKIRAA